jgi:mannose-6-phosphate isomerase-like protein (cupin superfamily)
MSNDLHVVHKVDGASYWVMGERATFKIRTKEYSLLEFITPPQTGPLPHTHLDCDEVYYVLEGQFEFVQPPDKPSHAGPGDIVRVERGMLHTYRNIGKTPGKFLLWVSPGYFADFFSSLGADANHHPTPPQAPPDFIRLIEIAQKYKMLVAMP